jgi:D-lyxose ketol-isomerase
MLTRAEAERARRLAVEYLEERARLVLTPDERRSIEVAELGLGQFERIGLCLLVYVNTERCCAKELVLLPGQTCPEHWHPPVGDDPGKEETFRCRWGEVYLYVEGEPTPNPAARPPAGREACFTVRHEIRLRPGEQYTLRPGIRHWFQAGPEGAVVSEFSTRSRDEFDRFTDPDVRRLAVAGR